jgi:hypothetical protein
MTVLLSIHWSYSIVAALPLMSGSQLTVLELELPVVIEIVGVPGFVVVATGATYTYIVPFDPAPAV